MDSLTQKSLKTTRSFTYTYYTSPPRNSALPTLLLIHGCPDSASIWSSLISTHLLPAGYGVVAPDCLGYAGTSKPTDVSAYAVDLMTNDLVEILDAEGIQKVITLGHDWGAILAQRLYNFHSNRVLGLVTLNVAYSPPSGQPRDLDQVNNMMISMIGYSPIWYWYLFTSDEGPGIIDAHVESFFTALHGPPESWMGIFCKEDGLRDYLQEDRRQEVLSYVTPQFREEFVGRMERDGSTCPLLWYRAMLAGLHLDIERKVMEETSIVKVPVLFIAATKVPLGLPQAVQQPVQMGLLPDFMIEEIEAGHWCMLAKPTEVGDAVTRWLERKF